MKSFNTFLLEQYKLLEQRGGPGVGAGINSPLRMNRPGASVNPGQFMNTRMPYGSFGNPRDVGAGIAKVVDAAGKRGKGIGIATLLGGIGIGAGSGLEQGIPDVTSGIGDAARETGEGIGDIGSGVGDIGTGIGSNIVAITAILAAAGVTGYAARFITKYLTKRLHKARNQRDAEKISKDALKRAGVDPDLKVDPSEVKI